MRREHCSTTISIVKAVVDGVSFYYIIIVCFVTKYWYILVAECVCFFFLVCSIFFENGCTYYVLVGFYVFLSRSMYGLIQQLFYIMSKRRSTTHSKLKRYDESVKRMKLLRKKIQSPFFVSFFQLKLYFSLIKQLVFRIIFNEKIL